MNANSDSNANSDLVLGVDGGGSKTVAWLAERTPDGRQAIIGKGRGGSSNGRSVGMENATRNLLAAIESAFEDAGRTPCRVAAACLAMAGADREIEKEHFRRWADESHLAQHTAVSNDAVPVIYAAFDDAVGIALIAGTGSLAVGRRDNGDVLRCGGWGGLFGDEGSGYGIAIAALRAAARAEDGRGPQTTLLNVLRQHFQVSTLNEAIPVIYDPTTSRAMIASIAPDVFDIASRGDEVAGEIVKAAAKDLSELVVTLCRRLSMNTDAMNALSLAITGSVLLNQPILRDEIAVQLTKAGYESVQFHPVLHPVAGAIAMACAAG